LLRLNGRAIEPAKLLDVLTDLEHAIGDIVYILIA
jgi:hypothetical protein